MKIFNLQDTLSVPSAPKVEVPENISTDSVVFAPAVETSLSISPTITKLKPIEPIRNVDSIFIALEKKEKEIKKIRERQHFAEKKTDQKKEKQKLTLPEQIQTFDSAQTYQPFANIDQSSQLIFPSIFKTKQTQASVQQLSPQSKTEVFPSDFFTGILLFISVLLVFTRIFFAKYFNNYFHSAFNYQLAYNLLRDKNAILNRFNFLLNIVYFGVLSVLIYQIIYFFDLYNQLSKIHYVYIFMFLVSVGIIRIVVLKTIGEVFRASRLFSEYLFSIFMFNKILGLVLFPVVFIIPFVPSEIRTILLHASIFIIISTFLVKLLRGFSIIIKKDVLLFYVILYLCTLEILPVLVGFTYFKRLV